MHDRGRAEQRSLEGRRVPESRRRRFRVHDHAHARAPHESAALHDDLPLLRDLVHHRRGRHDDVRRLARHDALAQFRVPSTNSIVTLSPDSRSNSLATLSTPRFTAPALNTFKVLDGVSGLVLIYGPVMGKA